MRRTLALPLLLTGCAADWTAPLVRVHLLDAPRGHALDGAGSIERDDLEARLDAVNDIFAPVGVTWDVASTVTTPARAVDATTAALDDGTARMATLMAAIPEEALLSPDGWDVVVVADTSGFGFGGVFTCGVGGAGGPAAAVVPVFDGAGDPQVLRKWAHEFGHAAGLPHTPCTEEFRDNLMMSGRCELADGERTGFTPAQEARMRRRLRKGRPMTCAGER